MGLFRTEKESATTRGRRLFTLFGVGATLMYFFDPAMGRTRRTQFAQRMGSLVRRTGRKAERGGRYVGAQAEGMKERIAAIGNEEAIPPNDQALVAKIESEALSRGQHPAGKINVNAEDGIVYLRGELDDASQISRLEQKVRKVTGVIDVQNLLHLPGETPANKESALKASRQR